MLSRSTRILLSFTLLLLFGATILAQRPVKGLRPTVILVSLDGFRYDYIEKHGAPTIGRMARNGVRAKWMIPAFPTKTFPNHYTIVTGLYPQNHGIVDNNVYDFGEVFTMSKRQEVENPRWWGGEPIWVTAEKQGQRAASYFFVGSEAPISGTSPSRWRTYNGRVPNEMRVDKVLGMLDDPADKRPTIITMYFSETDDVGHEFGPDAEETKYAVWNVDRYVERLMKGLSARGIADKVNVILVSDHGMANYFAKNAVYLDDHFDLDDAEEILWSSEFVQIFPKPGKLDGIYSKIKDLKNTTCWKKGSVPERLHYNDGKRVAPIVWSSDLGWMTTNRKRHNDWIKNLDDRERPRGAHGYDNMYPEMGALFVAHGPAFKTGMLAEPFSNVEVYNIMCRILGLTPAANDGDIRRVAGMLR